MKPARRSQSGDFRPDAAFVTAALDSLMEGCQVIDRDWRYLYVNEAVTRHGRRGRDDLLGRTMMEAYPGIEKTPMFAVLQRCMTERTPERMVNEFAYPDGGTGWFELRFEPVPAGVFILSLDITRRRLAEERGERLNAMLRGIRELSQLIARERDARTLVRRACELLVDTHSCDGVLIALTDGPAGPPRVHARAGDGLEDLGEALARGAVPEAAARVMASGAPDHRRASGRDRVILAVRHAGSVSGFLAASLPAGLGEDPEELELLREVASDLGAALRGMRLAAERDRTAADLAVTREQLWQAQKLEAVGRLAGGVAHDFNNLLAAQLGYCDLLEEGLREGDPSADDLAHIRTCAERAAGLTRQLLAFSRRQPMQMEVLDLNGVVHDMEGMLARVLGEGVAVASVPGAELGHVRADRGQIEQVILNLAVNARDAMPAGGRLLLETANVELDEDYVSRHMGAATGPHVMLAVSDTGCGMDEATRDRVFEPFFTTKERGKGTGLGLATVYGIVKQSGGNIWIYSEPGKGTTVKVYLPRVDEPLSPRVAREARAARGRGERVLLVEDEALLRDLFARMIADLGYTVDAVGDAAAALEAAAAHPPDLLLTDVILPGLSGKALAEQLLAGRPELKVVYASGYTDNTIVHHGILDADTAFLQKPFSGPELARKLREALDADA